MTDYVLVHGGFVGGDYWAETASLLRADGHRVTVVEQLPTSGPDAATQGTAEADVGVVGEAVGSLDGPVVLVGHSSAGVVITEFAADPRVGHTVYVAGYWPQRGQSMLDLLPGGPPPWLEMRDDGTAQFVDDLDVRWRTLCADVEFDRVEKALRAMRPVALAASATPSAAPDRLHPATYVVCEHDQLLPPQAQEMWAQRADHVVRLPSSHQPMVSMPDRLAEALGAIRL
ncbi:alpha/beta fold hydrolase [Pseudonocardia sp.]|uniref:alpha/beta fold hydrolase n=1 Tax=Pseudonocardia sp. TaxID=60912 RepID=UPI003D13FDF7